MRKIVSLLAVLVMCLALCIPAGAAKLQAEAPRIIAADVPDEVPASAQEWEVLRITNEERMNAGLQPLTMFSALQAAADVRAPELIQSFSHTRPDGTSCFTALDEAGISYSAAGENIAAGYQTPAAVMEGWMNSSGHRANILNSGFRHMGVGYTYSSGSDYGAYWVQLFCTGWDCSYTAFEILGDLDAETPIDELGLAGRFTCAEGYCYMPLASAMCTGDVTENGVRTVTFTCFGLTASVSIENSFLPGDIDGDGAVTVSDAVLAMRYAMGLVSLTPDQLAHANVDGDSDVDITDAVFIIRIAMGLA